MNHRPQVLIVTSHLSAPQMCICENIVFIETEDKQDAAAEAAGKNHIDCGFLFPLPVLFCSGSDPTSSPTTHHPVVKAR